MTGRHKRIRPRIGDVIEIRTPKGLAFAQYTHKHDRYGALLRVFDGQHPERPARFAHIVKQDPQFITFFPLGIACNRGIVEIAGHEDIPADARQFPLFRAGVPDNTGAVRQWWLWDGDREWPADIPPSDLQLLPIRGIANDTLLIERICHGWNAQSGPAV